MCAGDMPCLKDCYARWCPQNCCLSCMDNEVCDNRLNERYEYEPEEEEDEQ